MATTTHKETKIEKMDTALPLATGTADRAFAEVMKELAEIASGGTMSRMNTVISTYFPTEPTEAEKFMGFVDRLKRATEGTFSIAVGEQNTRRT
jgi:hypothetical protein